MALLVRVEKGGETILRAGYRASPVRIGRNPLNEVNLEEPVVSQWHGLVRFDEGQKQVTFMDLGSTNGTAFNGQPLAPHVPVVVGQPDVLSIGPLRLNLVVAHVPPELLEAGARSSFETSFAGGKATVAISSDAAKTQMLGEGMAATMMMDPGADPSALAGADATTVDSFAGAVAELEISVNRTRPAYEAYREAWSEVIRQVRARLSECAPEMRQHVAFALKTQLPQLAREPEFRALVEELGLEAVLGEEVDTSEWLHRLKFGAGSQAPREPINPRAAMERVGALLETFAESFVSLRRGYEQFGEDMALQVTQEQNALVAAKDYRTVLQVLLDWGADGAEVTEVVKRAFADLAIHQVALLHGFVEGVRDLVAQVGPEALSSGKSSVLPQGTGAVGVFRRKARLWNLYSRVHRSLIEEDRFARFVFGRSFARAYFDVTGGMVRSGMGRTEELPR